MAERASLEREAAILQHAATLALRDGQYGGRVKPTFPQVDPAVRERYIAQARRDIQAIEPYLLNAFKERLLSDEGLAEIREEVERQAEDEGLWANTINAHTAYVQQELRRLHALIEDRFSTLEASDGE